MTGQREAVSGGPGEDGALRLFVAIELPQAWQQALGQLQEEMRRALVADASLRGLRLRWVRPEAIHLTLKFLGEVEAARLPAIEAALAAAVQAPPGFELGLLGTGAFHDRRAPRVIWASLRADDRLRRLAERVDAGLGGAGFPQEKRPFAPHLTLARLPEDLPPPLRKRAAEVATACAPPPVAPLRVEFVSLMRSRLGSGGARYERLAAFPKGALQPPGADV